MPKNVTAIAGATVIDGTGAAPVADATVVLADGRVRSVAPSAREEIPQGATVIDAAGRYVIPGLMDANVHLFAQIPDLMLEYEGRFDELIEEAAQLTLRAGVTTVFDTAGPLAALVSVRDRINRGEVAGSRMFVAGHIIGFYGPLSREHITLGNVLGADTVARINGYWEQGVGPDLWWLTPEKLRDRIRRYVEESGVDFVKYAACAHDVPLISFSEPAQRVIVDEAHRAGLTVQAHTMSVESLRMEIEAGADLLTHPNVTGSEVIPDETMATIVDRALPGSALIWTERYRDHLFGSWSKRSKTLFGDPVYENGRRMIEAGARLLMTTDGSVFGRRVRSHPVMEGAAVQDAVDLPFNLGDSHFLWLEAVIQQGMAPMDALVSSTRYVAEAYGHGADLGTLEPGKRADLLILADDPLADVRNYRRIVEVMKDGVLVDRDALPVHRILTEYAEEAA